jgi:hypothetical protein
MNKLQEFTLSSPQSSTATMRSLADSARRCLGNFLPLAMMEGKKVGMGLVVMFGFGVGAFVLLISGSLTMLGCLVAGFVENNMLSWDLVTIECGAAEFRERLRPPIPRNQVQQGSPVLRHPAPALLAVQLRTEL